MTDMDQSNINAIRVVAEKRSGPVVLVLTRQKLPVLDPDRFPVSQGVPRGGYVIRKGAGGNPEVTLIATGAEVSLALEAADRLADDGIATRVVSLVSWEIFREQSSEYRESVLPPGVPRLAIEAGHSMGWLEIVGDSGDIISIDRFGASGPGPAVYADFGFSVENVIDHAAALVGGS